MQDFAVWVEDLENQGFSGLITVRAHTLFGQLVLQKIKEYERRTGKTVKPADILVTRYRGADGSLHYTTWIRSAPKENAHAR